MHAHRTWRRGAVVALLAMAAAWMLPSDSYAVSGIARQSVKQLFPEAKPLGTGKTQLPNNDAPVTLEADSMGYDQDKQIVVAVGHVVVAQADYVVNADTLTYYQQRGVVVATGNVSVLQPTGDVYFADKAQLNNSMSTGAIKQFKARLSDDSVLAANRAHKVNEAVTHLHQAVYSPCKICDNIAPFWQVKADRMRVDEEKQEMVYHNVQLDMFGVPTFYTPYLSGPTPNADGKSGILVPTYSSGANLGTNVKLPYYWRIADDKDATITPWFFSNDNPMLDVDYRQLTDHGNYNVQMSGINGQRFDVNGAKMSGNEFRGNIAATGVENIADYSRIGFDINRVSDQTYLKRYNIGGGDNGVLFSRLFAETTQQRNTASIQGLAIQGLRQTDNSKTTPQIWPTLDGYYETPPMDSGLRFHVAGNAQNLSRQIGANQRRISSTVGANYPYVTDNGQVITATANLRQDVYDLDHAPISTTETYSGTKERTIPQGAVQWRYPLVRASGSGSMTVEPLALAVAQPNGKNPAVIENEDSRLLELNDTNLFDIDRTPGYDVVDSGARVAYGVRSEYLFRKGESIDALLGESYSFTDSSPFPNSARLGRNTSDVIGRIGFNVEPISLAYRFALDQFDQKFDRNSVSFTFNKPWLMWDVSYNSIKNNSYIPDSEEISSKVTVPVTDAWRLYASGVRDLNLDRMTNAGAGAIYHNECFDFTLDGLRNYTHDRDVASGTSVTFRLGFKNLGVFGG